MLRNCEKVIMTTIVKAYLVVCYVFLRDSICVWCGCCWSFGLKSSCMFGMSLFPEEGGSRMRNGVYACAYACVLPSSVDGGDFFGSVEGHKLG